MFRENVLDIRPKSVCVVQMTMYVHWTCININRKDIHGKMKPQKKTFSSLGYCKHRHHNKIVYFFLNQCFVTISENMRCLSHQCQTFISVRIFDYETSISISDSNCQIYSINGS